MACDSELCHGAWASLIVQETRLFLSRTEATPVLPALSAAEGENLVLGKWALFYARSEILRLRCA